MSAAFRMLGLMRTGTSWHPPLRTPPPHPLHLAIFFELQGEPHPERTASLDRRNERR